MDRGAWWVIIHGVLATKDRTWRLNNNNVHNTGPTEMTPPPPQKIMIMIGLRTKRQHRHEKIVTLSSHSLSSYRPILWDPMDGSPPGSSVHGILQERILEWIAMPSSRGSSQPRDQTHVPFKSPALAARLFSTSATLGKSCLLHLL